MLVNPLPQSNRHLRGFFGSFCQSSFSAEEARTHLIESSGKPVWNTFFAFHDRSCPVIELLPFEILVSGRREDRPGNMPCGGCSSLSLLIVECQLSGSMGLLPQQAPPISKSVNEPGAGPISCECVHSLA